MPAHTSRCRLRTSYIALAFALAIERQKTELPRKNIAIICASGQGSARLLAYRYREAFGAYLDRIVTCDVSRIDSLDLTGIDYVFTTVPLHRTMPVPVREVGMFLDDRDVVCVREAFRDGSCDAGVETPLMKYFDSRLFHAHLACTTKDEVLDLICAEVEQCYGVDPDFRDLVFQREALAPTAFGNSAAMPHPLRPASDETFFTVLLLEHPILWDGREVQAVFFLSIAREDREGLDAFYDQFSDVLMSEKLISRMVSDQRLETLIEIFGKANPNKGV